MPKQRRRKTRVRTAKRPDRDAVWERRLAELKAYRRQHGSCQVPSRSKQHPSLGHWVHYQRVLQRSDRLSAARRRQLKQVGFDWVSRGRSLEFRDSTYWDTKWERMLGRLARFHRRFGHCLVPTDWAGTPRLSPWVARQRHFKQQGVLSEDRWRRLKALGLEWKTGDSIAPRWERCFLRLREFHRRFGHAHVPAEWAENITLGRWVVKTRRLRAAGRLSVEQVRRLNELGFVWDPLRKRQDEHDAVWSAWLTTLQAFHHKYGHWRVPTEQRRFHRLRVWMDNQRINYHRGWLAAARIRQLNAIKFPWVSDRGATLHPRESRAAAATPGKKR